jgi:hypothetical protein
VLDAKIRRHIESLALTLPRLVRLAETARTERHSYSPLKDDEPTKDRGCTRLQWRTAAAIVQRVAMNIRPFAHVPHRAVIDLAFLRARPAKPAAGFLFVIRP